ncbi:hypothetical protein QOT17_014280 [Balamuthia mandrillaris]
MKQLGLLPLCTCPDCCGTRPHPEHVSLASSPLPPAVAAPIKAASSKPALNILCLPPDIRQHVFSFLDDRGLAAALRTCKTWFSDANDPALWAALFQRSTWNPNDVSEPEYIALSKTLRTVIKRPSPCGNTLPLGCVVTATTRMPGNCVTYFEVLCRIKSRQDGWGCQTAVGVVTEVPLKDLPISVRSDLPFYAGARVYPLNFSKKGWAFNLNFGVVEHRGKTLNKAKRPITFRSGSRVGVLYDNTSGQGLLNFYHNGLPLLDEPLRGIKGPLYPAVQMCCHGLNLSFRPDAPLPAHYVTG